MNLLVATTDDDDNDADAVGSLVERALNQKKY